TVLASSLNPSTVDQSVALTATISPGTPTGTVGFTSNGATISGCGAVSVASSQAACTTTFSAVGTYSIVATYSGDSNNLGSTSAALAQVVNAATTTPQLDLTASPTSLSVVGGQDGTVKLTVSTTGTLTSSVTFACSGLPSDASCTFSPSSVSGASLPASVTMTISTTTADAQMRKPMDTSWAIIAMLLPGLLVLPGRTRKIKMRRLRKADWMLLGVLVLLAVSWVGRRGGRAKQDVCG
ncbi:MAG: Ig-like domain-containing protein, partial [Terriglobales bacterium]